MTEMSNEAISDLLGNYEDPELNCALGDIGLIKSLDISSSHIRVVIQLGFACAGYHQTLSSELQGLLQKAFPGVTAEVAIEQHISAYPSGGKIPALAEVRNIIAVASGKGGVGKSTTAVNLALALAAEGARVGILDADIYGPSQGMMLGIPEGQRPEVDQDKYFIPITAHGIQAMSMSFLVTDSTPMVWRGPMASGALQQLLTQTHWHDLDYLLIDMPPGTGDIQLTLSQKAPVSGAVIVTTPQDIALLDCKKGIEMFRKVDIPVLGVVENMSLHVCSNCGHEEAVFGAGGGERIARDYNTELLGQLPLELAIREMTDQGTPTVVAAPQSTAAGHYRSIARRVGASIARNRLTLANIIPNIVVQSD